MFKLATPVLRVSGSAAAGEFYCGKLGFRIDSAYRVIEARPDPCHFTRHDG